MSRPLTSIAVLLLLALVGCSWGEETDDNNAPSDTTPQQIGSKLSGVCLGPYLTGNPNTGSQISESNLRTLLGYVTANFTSCRTYGSLSGLEKFPAIAKELGLKVAAGCWLGTDLDANDHEVDSLISSCVAGDVDIAVVGSEVLLRNDLTEDQLLGYIAQVKDTGVKVTTADTWNTLVSHPRIIAACDEVWANIYPFWEGVSVDQAMERLQSDLDQIEAVTDGKKVVISETGWPSAGGAHQAAVPSPQNEAKYFADFVSWANTRDISFYYFEMFDEPWKTEPGLVGAHWGIWDSSKRLKPGCEDGFAITP